MTIPRGFQESKSLSKWLRKHDDHHVTQHTKLIGRMRQTWLQCRDCKASVLTGVNRRCDCCDRGNEYNGFASGPLSFICPKECSCHD